MSQKIRNGLDEYSRCGVDIHRSLFTLAQPNQKASVPIFLEPALSALNVSSHEIFVRLGEIHDPFDYCYHVHHGRQHKARQDSYQEHNNTFGLVAKDKLMNTKSADDDGANASHNLLISAPSLPVLRRHVPV